MCSICLTLPDHHYTVSILGIPFARTISRLQMTDPDGIILTPASRPPLLIEARRQLLASLSQLSVRLHSSSAHQLLTLQTAHQLRQLMLVQEWLGDRGIIRRGDAQFGRVSLGYCGIDRELMIPHNELTAPDATTCGADCTREQLLTLQNALTSDLLHSIHSLQLLLAAPGPPTGQPGYTELNARIAFMCRTLLVSDAWLQTHHLLPAPTGSLPQYAQLLPLLFAKLAALATIIYSYLRTQLNPPHRLPLPIPVDQNAPAHPPAAAAPQSFQQLSSMSGGFVTLIPPPPGPNPASTAPLPPAPITPTPNPTGPWSDPKPTN